MGFIEKLRLISDEVYNKRDIYLCNIDGKYKCYTVFNGQQRELIIDNRYTSIYKMSELLIILRDRRSTNLCVIDTYCNQVREYTWTVGMLDKIYKDYITINFSDKFIRYLETMSLIGEFKGYIQHRFGYATLVFKVDGINEIFAICDDRYTKWVFTPFDNLGLVHMYSKNLWVIIINGSMRLYYNGRISKSILFKAPYILEYKGKTYINCVTRQDYYNKVFMLQGNEYVEHMRSKKIIRNTCQRGLVLKQVDDDTNRYDIIELGTNKICLSGIKIIHQLHLDTSSSK